jgi:putative hydroxymethylpyrimidine transport system substrate-binding protein
MCGYTDVDQTEVPLKESHPMPILPPEPMNRPARHGRRRLMAGAGAAMLAAGLPAKPASAAQKFTVLLDWFVNPDHAPLFAAKYIGAFERAGLDVDLVAPTDPDLPPRLLAAGKADVALSYQTQLYLLVDQGLPVRRTGTLINKPLNTLTALGGRRISKLADLKGKKIGYSVAGVEEALISTMLASAGLTMADVTLVNVNFALITALMSHEVDACIGTYRTYEDIQLKQAGLKPVIFLPEDYGVPPSDELIMLSNTSGLASPALPKFLAAVKEGTTHLIKNVEPMLAKFVQDQPSLNDKLDKASWRALPGYFAKDPAVLDIARYTSYRDFMFRTKLIKQSLPLSNYAVQIAG